MRTGATTSEAVSSRCCPPASQEAWKIRLIRSCQVSETALGCPIAVEQIPQVDFRPQYRPENREESREAMRPFRNITQVTQQHIHQQGDPDLPAHGVGVVAEEVGQLQCLLDLFEEDLN